MFKSFAFAVVAVALAGAAFANLSQASETAMPKASYAAVGGSTSVPYGWVDFCGRRPEECSLGKLQPLDVRLKRRAGMCLTGSTSASTPPSSR